MGNRWIGERKKNKSESRIRKRIEDEEMRYYLLGNKLLIEEKRDKNERKGG